MKLIGSIINELVSRKTSLEPPLLKTKVLASRIGNRELLDWAKKEVCGYKRSDEIPKYRQYATRVLCDFLQGTQKHLDQVVPRSDLNIPHLDSLMIFEWVQGVTSLESLTSSYKGGQLIQQGLFAEDFKLIEICFANVGKSDIHVLSAYRESFAATVHEVLSTIRSRLLDFLLKLETEFGEHVEIEQLKINRDQVTTIMNQTFYNSGDGIVVNTGNDATLHVNINITKGDKDALRAKLLENKVAPTDADELLAIVDEGSPNGDSFGSKVNSWIGKMLMKAANGSWQIAAGAAGNILATVLQQYYGTSR